MLKPNPSRDEFAEWLKAEYSFTLNGGNESLETSLHHHAVHSLGMCFAFVLERFMKTPAFRTDFDAFGLTELSDRTEFEKQFPDSVDTWDRRAADPYWLFKMFRNAFAHAQWDINITAGNNVIHLYNKHKETTTFEIRLKEDDFRFFIGAALYNFIRYKRPDHLWPPEGWTQNVIKKKAPMHEIFFRVLRYDLEQGIGFNTPWTFRSDGKIGVQEPNREDPEWILAGKPGK